MSFWTVPREWEGDPCFILGGGPSLTKDDAERVQGRGWVLAINEAYRICSPRVHYFCDLSWWLANREKVLLHPAKYRVSIGTDMDGTLRLHSSGYAHLSTDPGTLGHGANSGFQALNLAFLFGAKTIVLLGFDMRADENGKTHWHEPHRNGLTQERFKWLLANRMIPAFWRIAQSLKDAGVRVINCTPNSALKCFEMRTLDEVLNDASLAHQPAL